MVVYLFYSKGNLLLYEITSGHDNTCIDEHGWHWYRHMKKS